jgi:hypothetical protein
LVINKNYFGYIILDYLVISDLTCREHVKGPKITSNSFIITGRDVGDGT